VVLVGAGSCVSLVSRPGGGFFGGGVIWCWFLVWCVRFVVVCGPCFVVPRILNCVRVEFAQVLIHLCCALCVCIIVQVGIA